MKSPRTRAERRTGWRRGVAAGLAGLGVVEGVAAALDGRSFLDAAGQLIVDTGPVPVVERTVQVLKTADKPVIRGGVAATVLAATGLLARAPRRAVRDIAALGGTALLGATLTQRRAPQGELGFMSRGKAGLAAGTGIVAALATLTAPRAALVPLGVAGAGALGAGLRSQARRHSPDRHTRTDEPSRALLRPGHPLPPAVDGAERWPGVRPLITPLERFYVTDVNMRPPVIDPDRWRLAVTGTVAAPLSLDYNELVGLGLVEFDATMVCIHNRLGWDRLGTARWLGVPLRQLLAAAQPDPVNATLVSRSADGWECSIPLPMLDDLEAYVVVGMNGQPLTGAHGSPARLFVPGLYGQYTGAKWLTELRLQKQPNRDYWLPRGWPHGPIRIRPLSQIDRPDNNAKVTEGVVDVVGVAWAPPGGVEQVDVAVDDQPWITAELADELAPAAWRRWRVRVELPPGHHRLRARCLARDQTMQDPAPRPPFPSGATGHHTVEVTVLAHPTVTRPGISR